MNKTTTSTIKDLLEAGVHFGHSTTRWNPKMKPYIFGQRDRIYIVDLQQTQQQLQQACDFAKKIIAQNGKIIFVGTKRQAQDVIKEEAERCKMPYVITRWLGGTMTNFKTIKKRIDKLLEMEKMEEEGKTAIYTKKELAKFNKQKQRLLRNLAGIKHMDKLPQAVFIVDTRREKTALREAKRLNIPIIALVDTNANPDPIDYCIVGNDDAIKAIRVIVKQLADSVLTAQQLQPKEQETVAVAPQPPEEKTDEDNN